MNKVYKDNRQKSNNSHNYFYQCSIFPDYYGEVVKESKDVVKTSFGIIEKDKGLLYERVKKSIRPSHIKHIEMMCEREYGDRDFLARQGLNGLPVELRKYFRPIAALMMSDGFIDRCIQSKTDNTAPLIDIGFADFLDLVETKTTDNKGVLRHRRYLAKDTLTALVKISTSAVCIFDGYSLRWKPMVDVGFFDKEGNRIEDIEALPGTVKSLRIVPDYFLAIGIAENSYVTSYSKQREYLIDCTGNKRITNFDERLFDYLNTLQSDNRIQAAKQPNKTRWTEGDDTLVYRVSFEMLSIRIKLNETSEAKSRHKTRVKNKLKKILDNMAKTPYLESWSVDDGSKANPIYKLCINTKEFDHFNKAKQAS